MTLAVKYLMRVAPTPTEEREQLVQLIDYLEWAIAESVKQ
jgi:hypothetical protein